MVRPAQGKREIHLVRSSPETYDVLQRSPQDRERRVSSAGNHIRGRGKPPECLCLQGQGTDGKDGTLCRPVLQRDAGKRLYGFCQNREAERPDLRETSRILGEEVLADGVLPSGSAWQPDQIKSRSGHESGKGQTFRP